MIRRGVKRERGLTLIELMVVLGVVGVLAAIATANMPHMKQDKRIAAGARNFAALVRQAQGRAIANRSFVEVNVNSNVVTLIQSKCDFLSQDLSSATNCDTKTLDRITYNAAGPIGDFMGVTITPPGSPARLIFAPWGAVDSSSSNHTGVYKFESARSPLAFSVSVTAQGLARQ